MMFADVQKNGKETIRVSIEEYKGHEYVDIRVYANSSGGAWVPTPRGVGVPIKALVGVMKGLMKVYKHLQEIGQLPATKAVNNSGEVPQTPPSREEVSPGKLTEPTESVLPSTHADGHIFGHMACKPLTDNGL